MKLWHWLMPLVAVLCGAVMLLRTARTPQDEDGGMHIRRFAQIPVVQKGRVKPLDTLARTSLMIISDRGEQYTDLDDRKQPAIRWLLEVMTCRLRDKDKPKENQAVKLKVFRIENDQVLGMFGLEERPGSYRYSEQEIMQDRGEDPLAPAKSDEAESQRQRFAARVKAAQKKPESDHDLVDTKVLELATALNIFYQLADLEAPHVVPPAKSGQDWQTLIEAAQAAGAHGSGELRKEARQFADVLKYYSEGNTSAFNEAVEKYLATLNDSRPDDVRVARFEVFFNSLSPFYRCLEMYVAVLVLVVVGWLVFPLGWSRPFWRSAFWLMVLVFCVHTFAIVARIYIQGRPPVTNLYSSAIFIGWVVALMALVVESLSRIGVATAAGALIGVLTLIVAYHLGIDGDTMEMLRAVLDTNFWLATHVTSITIGYAATFMAGMLGTVYILAGVFSPLLRKDVNQLLQSVDTAPLGTKMDVAKLLTTMTYGVVCFAMLFSFVGTVLGGIWGDQSWGRFWGWDPKENGAVLIVIWNALVLHARWGGMIRQRGLAMLTVFGGIVTAWSWFGTNMLGVGLHAYGFIPSQRPWLIAYMSSQLVIIAVGLLPERYWISNLNRPTPPLRSGTPRKGEGVKVQPVA